MSGHPHPQGSSRRPHSGGRGGLARGETSASLSGLGGDRRPATLSIPTAGWGRGLGGDSAVRRPGVPTHVREHAGAPRGLARGPWEPPAERRGPEARGGREKGPEVLLPLDTPLPRVCSPQGPILKPVALQVPAGQPWTWSRSSDRHGLSCRPPPGTAPLCPPALRTQQYLQIFFVFIDVVQLEDMGVLDQLQDGDFPLHLRGRGRRHGRPGSSPDPCAAHPPVQAVGSQSPRDAGLLGQVQPRTGISTPWAASLPSPSCARSLPGLRGGPGYTPGSTSTEIAPVSPLRYLVAS